MSAQSKHGKTLMGLDAAYEAAAVVMLSYDATAQQIVDAFLAEIDAYTIDLESYRGLHIPDVAALKRLGVLVALKGDT